MLADTTSTTAQPTVLTRQEATDLLASRYANAPHEVDASQSHFYHPHKAFQHQSWMNGGYIGTRKTEGEHIAWGSIRNVITLHSDHTILCALSAVDADSEILKEYSVKPPETADESAISAMFQVNEGIYTVRKGRYCLTGPEYDGVEAKLAHWILGSQADNFDWTAGDIEYYALKPETATSNHSIIPLQ